MTKTLPAVLVVGLTLAGACNVRLGLDVTRFGCVQDLECGPGYVCRPSEVEPTTNVCVAGDESTGDECVTDAFCAGRTTPDVCFRAICAGGTCGVEPDVSAPCDDGDACTVGDACISMGCSGQPLTCVALDACHGAGSCEPATGLCTQPQLADGTSCDDGDACTKEDSCKDGVCEGEDCPCRTPDDCAGMIGVAACQRVACVDYECVLETDPSQEFGQCEDGNPCTIGDACASGECVGTAVNCANLNSPCATGVCDGGVCVADLATPGASCDPKRACIVEATCSDDGQCIGAWDVDQCGCQPSTACDDGDPCTYDDACTESSTCVGTSYDCIGLPCEQGTCDGTGGCVFEVEGDRCLVDGKCIDNGVLHANNECLHCDPVADARAWTPNMDGTACDADGDPCTNGDTCVSGTCIAGDWPCDDGVTCTADSCLPSATAPEGYECTNTLDGDSCLVGDVCFEAGTTEDSNSCETCAPESSGTDWTTQPDGAACGSTAAEACVGGTCIVPTETVTIPEGDFYMGCSGPQASPGDDASPCMCDEEASFLVKDLPAYGVDLTEVTTRQYEACVAAGACSPPTKDSGLSVFNYGKADRAEHPINYVTWDDAVGYCSWVGKRLCTAAEWERAARGGCGLHPAGVCEAHMQTFPWGEAPPNCGHAVWTYGGCVPTTTAEVGSKPDGASPYGVLDMAGNVWEWVEDIYDPNSYPGSSGCAAPGSPQREIRGASYGENTPSGLRPSRRAGRAPDDPGNTVGFRCCAELEDLP